MTATAVVSLTGSETEVITRAEGVLKRGEYLLDSGEPGTFGSDEGQGRRALRYACDELAEALAYHEGLRDDSRHPADWYWDLAEGWPDDAKATAMERVAEDIAAWADALEMVIAEHVRTGGET